MTQEVADNRDSKARLMRLDAGQVCISAGGTAGWRGAHKHETVNQKPRKTILYIINQHT